MIKGKWLLCTLVIAGIFFISCKSVKATDYSAENNFSNLTEYPLVKNDVEIIFVETPKAHAPETCEDSFTKEEIDLMARVVMSESSILHSDAKQAIAQTILNRLNDGRWGDTIHDVVYYPNAYSTADNGEPTEECYRAVESAIQYPTAFPTDMYWFNSNHYPNYGHPYTVIDGMYFSTETNYHTGEEE